VGAETPMLVGADAPRPASNGSSDGLVGAPERLADEGPPRVLVGGGRPRRVVEGPPRLVGYDSPVLAGDDAAKPQTPSTEPDEPQSPVRWRRERPSRDRRGGDQRPAFSRWAENRQGLRQPDAGAIEDESEMERQVRDQLYGPGFRRR
jgi:hypothetical protein